MLVHMTVHLPEHHFVFLFELDLILKRSRRHQNSLYFFSFVDGRLKGCLYSSDAFPTIPHSKEISTLEVNGRVGFLSGRSTSKLINFFLIFPF